MIKRNYFIHKETIHNFIWRSLQIFGKQGIIFFIFILSAKVLSPYDFGIYNYSLAFIFFLIMFADFGISTATSKYVAEYNETDKTKLKLVLFNLGIIIAGLTILITILTLIAGPWYLKDRYVYVLYLLPLIFLVPMASLYDGIYRGLKRFKQLAIISLVIGFISIFLIYYIINFYGLIGALISQNLFYLILLIGLGFGYREFDLEINRQIITEVGKYSFFFGMAILGYYLFSKIDVLILGHFGYIREIATYELINKIFLIVLFPFTIFGQIVAPNFAALCAKKQYKLIFDKYIKYLRIFIVCAVVSSFILIFITPFIIKMFFQNYYDDLYFIIFIPTLMIYAFNIFNAPINAGIIVATGYAKLMSYMNIFLGFFNLILSILLIYPLGFMGVIYATLISNVTGTLILHLRYYNLIKNEK